MKKIVFVLFLLFQVALPLWGQESSSRGDKIAVTQRDYQNQSVEMADSFRSEGKIYVVVAVLSTIFVGIVGYLLLFERRLSKLEKEIRQQSSNP
jgi:CcmD family protein